MSVASFGVVQHSSGPGSRSCAVCWQGGAVPKRETKFPKEQTTDVVSFLLLSFLPREEKEIDMGEIFVCQMELNILDKVKIFFLSRESFAHTLDQNYVGVLKASMYFKTSVIPALTPRTVAETSYLRAWASFLQVQ